MGVSLTETPSWTQTHVERDPPGQNPPGLRPSLDRDPPWTETPLDRDPLLPREQNNRQV